MVPVRRVVKGYAGVKSTPSHPPKRPPLETTRAFAPHEKPGGMGAPIAGSVRRRDVVSNAA